MGELSFTKNADERISPGRQHLFLGSVSGTSSLRGDGLTDLACSPMHGSLHFYAATAQCTSLEEGVFAKQTCVGLGSG